MLRRWRRQWRSVTVILLAGIAGLWLAAALTPCVMAAPDCPDHQTGKPMGPDCGMQGTQLTLDCDLPPANTPTAVAPDFAFLPALLAIVPAATIAPTIQRPLVVSATAPPPNVPPY